MQNTTLKKALAFSCLTLTLALSAAFSNDAKAAASDYTLDDLVWSDEFSGETLNEDTWTYEYGNNGTDGNLYGWGNNEKQYYKPNNVSIADISNDAYSGSQDGRALAITAKREEAGNCDYTSGRIKTAGKQSFKYGRVECKMKIDNGMCKGIWPAFWMLGSQNGGWPHCGEIDIMEHANTNRFVGGAVHWADSNNQHAYDGRSCSFKSGDMNTWHIYAIEWNEEQITWYVDDKAYYTFNIKEEHSELQSDFYILFNMAVGGNYIGNALPSSDWTGSTMYVDYVRVYQKASDNGSYIGTWKKDPIMDKCNVSFMDGSNVVIAGTILKGQYLAAQNAPVKEGYEFVGWCTADGTLFDFSKPVTSDTLVLYTKYKVAETTVAPTTVTPTKVTKPNKPSIKSLKSKAKKKATIKLKLKGEYKGFQVKYGTNKKVTKNVKTKLIKKKTYTFKKLKSKKTYYFKVRAYKLDANGKKLYGKWSKSKKVIIK